MFADPQTVTINAIANTLPRTQAGIDAGVFSKDDGNVKLSIKDTYASRTRRLARLDIRKVASDPLATGYNKEYNMSVYLVVDHPPVGFSIAEIKQQVDGLTLWLTASSGANVTKLIGGEA
uniref:Uncharacterized protein n=1 Tax=Leviviridae sp. TaxID=2027243 RepID=A0A514D508_9VIRU|nr:MAG: hypothetical protein H4BulkL23319e1256_000002 [Leviviridae sp.]